MIEGTAPLKGMLNPPLQIIGVAQEQGSMKLPAIGFQFAGPGGENLAILFTTDKAELFIADMIQALKQVTGVIKPPSADS